MQKKFRRTGFLPLVATALSLVVITGALVEVNLVTR